MSDSRALWDSDTPVIWVARQVRLAMESREKMYGQTQNRLSYRASEIETLQAETGECVPNNSMIVAGHELCKESRRSSRPLPNQMATTPLDPQAVITALQNATSQSPAQLQAAAKAIKAMHKSADYLQIVQSIALERLVPLDIRKMAILQFKNVATSQWRTKMCAYGKSE
jgi:Importin-beta N-terminal domain